MTEDDWWRSRAACRGLPTGLFYPEDATSRAAASRGRREAVLICHSCPVERECLAAALDEESVWPGIVWGVRGGTSYRLRRRMVRAARTHWLGSPCTVCGRILYDPHTKSGHRLAAATITHAPIHRPGRCRECDHLTRED